MIDMEPTVETLLLADRAEAVNGKLYIMGGGWDTLAALGSGTPSSFWAAISILIPWQADNIEYSASIRLEDQEAHTLVELPFRFKADRAHLPADGVVRRVMLAVPFNLVFSAAGIYLVRCTVGTNERAVRFQVVLSGPDAERSIA